MTGKLKWGSMAVGVSTTLAMVLTGCGTAGAASSKPAVPNETIALVSATNQAEGIAQAETDFKKAASVLGWKTQIEDGQNSPTVWSGEIQNAVAQHVSAIVTLGIDAATASGPMAAAKSANIPVIAAGFSVNPVGASAFTGVYENNDQLVGASIGRYLAKKSPKSGVVGQTLSLVYAANQVVRSANVALKASGKKMLAIADNNATNIPTSFAQTAVSLIRQNPKAKYIVGCADFVPPIDTAALQQAGIKGVTVVAPFETTTGLSLIRQGAPVIIAATNSEQSLLVALNALAAFFTNKTPIPPRPYIPTKVTIVTKANVPKKGFTYNFGPMLQAQKLKWNAEYTLP